MSERPNDGQTVWVEYPEGKHFRATYDESSDTYTPDGERPIRADVVCNWSEEEREDYDISDEPTAPEKGKLTRS